MRTRLVIGLVAAATALAACSSGTSQKATVASPAASRATAPPTTQSNAIGLRVNADERAEQVPDKPLTPAQSRELAAQLAIARAEAMKYPTVADALKAGLIQAGLFTPGAGAHYVSVAGSVGGLTGAAEVDPAKPEAWIYDGTDPTSRIVGLMYASFSVEAPQGFAGPNDHWHRHTNLCVTFGGGKINIPFAPDSSVTRAQCTADHGMFMRRTFWMVHAWVVPNWKSPQGVFSHANINLHCGDGTDNTDNVGFCRGTLSHVAANGASEASE
jgi:hypothetical protein